MLGHLLAHKSQIMPASLTVTLSHEVHHHHLPIAAGHLVAPASSILPKSHPLTLQFPYGHTTSSSLYSQ